jgi:hypothetical protein
MVLHAQVCVVDLTVSPSLTVSAGAETRPVFTHSRFLQYLVNFIVADDQVCILSHILGYWLILL